MNRTKFSPVKGEVYRNQGGGEYRCVKAGNAWSENPIMQNVKSGWTLTAHGVGIYDDGTIDWDYSTGGYFDEVGSNR